MKHFRRPSVLCAAAALALAAAMVSLLTFCSRPEEDAPSSFVLPSYSTRSTGADSSAAGTSAGISEPAASAAAPTSTAGGTTAGWTPAVSAATTSRASSAAATTAGTTLSHTVWVETKPGWSLPEIAREMEAKGACTAKAFLDAANTADFSDIPMVAAIPASPARPYRLEGYLAADKYNFYRDGNPRVMIRTMLETMEQRVKSLIGSGQNIHEVLTRASIIEREVTRAENDMQRRRVSAVIRNRLAIGMPLQMDCTIVYLEEYVKKWGGINIDPYRSLYNLTYKKNMGLPPGPIASPGNSAIQAALNPTDDAYLYFCARGDTALFAVEEEDHDANCAALGIGR